MNRLSVIIPAKNEADSLRLVLDEVVKLTPDEIIIILNGCTDSSRHSLNQYPCKIIEYPLPLGNDTGRALGAYHSIGDIILFLDGDIPISALELAPFVESIKQGHDIALNNLIWSSCLPIRPHTTTVIKQATNHLLKQSQLSVNSILAIPHALSRKALNMIGWWNLVDPVLTQAIAAENGLSIHAPISIDVIHRNKVRNIHLNIEMNSPYPITTNRIIGDHLTAIHYLLQQRGFRGGFSEGNRNRAVLKTITPQKLTVKGRRSAVIPVGEEAATIEGVIKSVKNAGITEIIVVANGADETTIKKARLTGANVIVYNKALGHNVGRAIGALFCTGETILFVDGDFIVPSEDLVPFITAVENGTDIALNNLESLLDRFYPIDPISAVKYFLNISLNMPTLLNNSLTAVPFAIKKQVIESIGYDSLIIPPLALAKAILMGYEPRAVHYVNVVEPNRRRSEHEIEKGRIPAFDRIFGDHMEAFQFLLSKKDERGGFSDGNRDRSEISRLLIGGE
ncbi:glycosyltransferase family 2 protein [Bacillus sp. DNRA2]|uniref:glycosyltransferase family 2 protein n=1 Tax=Bacillus sp. DNRA2 TaxID=2723053 RepID=UPI00145D10D7|nr:glycosyltransferase [Bacillus sp. DNRA2]NMD70477.1 glycosyltransferase family 2 protein [Bacillus sp. DNRA2]